MVGFQKRPKKWRLLGDSTVERREDLKKIFKEGEKLLEVKEVHRSGFIENKVNKL